MTRFILILALAAIAAACGKTVYVPVESGAVRTDTVYSAKFRTDSVMLRDSVSVRQKGDTVFETRYRDRYRVSERIDTLYLSVTDSVKVPVPYPVERELSRWERTKMDFGGFAMGGFAIVICVAVAWLVRRFRRR